MCAFCDMCQSLQCKIFKYTFPSKNIQFVNLFSEWYDIMDTMSIPALQCETLSLSLSLSCNTTYHEQLDCIGDVHKPNRRLVAAWATQMNTLWSTKDFFLLFFDKRKIVRNLRSNLEENNEYVCPEYILCTCIILYLEFLAPHDAPLGHSHQIQTKLEKRWNKQKYWNELQIKRNFQKRNCFGSIYIGDWNILQRIAIKTLEKKTF